MNAITSAESSRAKRPAAARRALASREPRHACSLRTAGENITSSGCTAVSAASWRASVMSLVSSSLCLHLGGQFCRDRKSFLCWIVGRIDIVDRPRPDTVNLTDCLFVGPHIVVSPGLHDRDAAGGQGPGLRGVEHAAEPHVQRAGDDGDVLNAGMPMRHDFEIGGKLEPEHDVPLAVLCQCLWA